MVKNLPDNAGDIREVGSIPGLGRSPGGNGKPLQYSCLENCMDRGTWLATVHGVAESQTWLSTHAQFKDKVKQVIIMFLPCFWTWKQWSAAGDLHRGAGLEVKSRQVGWLGLQQANSRYIKGSGSQVLYIQKRHLEIQRGSRLARTLICWIGLGGIFK